MFATNWSSNGGLAAEASVTCRRSQWFKEKTNELMQLCITEDFSYDVGGDEDKT